MRKSLILFLMLLLPAFACAEISFETISEAYGKMATNRYSFSQEVPDVVREKLEAVGYGNVNCVSGLCIERLVLDRDDLYRGSDALMILETDGVYTLAGMQWNIPEKPVYFQEYGSLGLALEKGFQLQFVPSELRTVDYQLTAECEGVERSWRINRTGQNVWYIEACETPGGENVSWDEMEGAFELHDGLHYACWWPQLEGLTSFAEYPVTQAQAAQLAADSWAGIPIERLAVLGGNLREKPTGNSRSLGYSQGNVLGEILGQKSGVYEPWYQVRVGNTVGWTSGSYVHPLNSTQHPNGVFKPLKLATLREDAVLQRSQDDHTPVMTLQAGAELQVLYADSDGWLHVVVPTARATRCMDINGTYGYVRLEEVNVEGLILP